MPDASETIMSASPPGEDGGTTPVPRSGSAAGVKRKRGGTTTASRTVANLTPEQLDKKRKNDREAQRAIRERTRAQIDRLNQRIAELEGADHYQERLAAIRHRDQVQNENEELKRKMAQVVAMLSPIIGSNSQRLDDLASAALERNALPIPQSQPMPQSSFIAPRAMTSPAASVMSPVSHSSLPNSFGSTMQSASHQHAHHRSWESGYDVASPRPHSADYRRDESRNLGFVFDSNMFAPAPIPIHGLSAGDKSLAAVPPIHKMLPRAYCSCALDNLLLDYLRESQRRLARGEATFVDETGPEDVNFNTLVDPNTRHKPHVLSKLFLDILGTFPDLKTLPEQVAVVHVMFTVMRWQIHPTRENYERIPEWVRPIHVQLLHPHPHWVDYIPWPKMRLLAAQEPVDINIFFVPYTTTFSVNWPYDPQSCLITAAQTALSPNMSPPNATHSPAATSSTTPRDDLFKRPRRDDMDDYFVLNPLFREHMYNLENWSLGEAFAREFPQWRGSFKIKK